VCGISTRRVDQLVESLGHRTSRSEVSRICGLLHHQVEAFRQRPLEGRYPYLFLDAREGQEGGESAYGIGSENGPDVIPFEDGASA
jgi:hypothetical protein